jgi:hypothetical protein
VHTIYTNAMRTNKLAGLTTALERPPDRTPAASDELIVAFDLADELAELSCRLSLRARRDDHPHSTRHQLYCDGRRADRFTIGLYRLLLPHSFDGDAFTHCQRA